MKRLFVVMSLVLLIALMQMLHARNAYCEHEINKTVIARSLLSKGNIIRLQNVLTRARRGEDIVVGVIGGSITEGSNVKREDRWGNLVYRWWQESFPQSKVKFINAGIGGSNSNYGAHRVQRDLLKYNPDFIIVEFAVNDSESKFAAETLEGLTRQSLKSQANPALLLLFMTYEDGHNAQEWHSRVGKHYGLPMISYGDAIMSAIKEGHLRWRDISDDIVHPNSMGNKYCAQFIIAFLNSILSDMPDHSNPANIYEIPQPLISDTFEYTATYQNKDIKFKKNTGWFEFESGWKANSPGSVIEFEVSGRVVSVMYNQKRSDMGIVEASVDDNLSVKLNGWVNASWTRQQVDFVALNLDDGRHTLRIKILNESDKSSTGHIFEIREIMVAGLLPEHRDNYRGKLRITPNK